MQKKRTGSLIASFVIVAVFLGGVWQRQVVFDWFRLRNYTPSAEIIALGDRTTMSNNTRRLFYVYHPELNDKATFNDHCTGGEQTIVLGCYIHNRGIYIYNVTDVRLNGILEVTAAHETLHATYDRLSSSERQRIDGFLNQAFAGIKDERILKTIESYRKNGADIVNELHSILGTEVRNLSPELENYYKQYFNDRSKIVAYSEQYEQAFTERKTKVEDYDKQLANLKQQAEANQSSLNIQVNALNTEKQQLDRLLAQKQYDAYNQAVPDYNIKIKDYNALVNQTKALITQYNFLVEARNALALEENQLYKAIDSRPNTLQIQ
ncbi:hypothetical protein HY003_02345 [Candidatus Saccharibacteria bacterium]|nr:hypothetical protein [Candidatus Saccharibacteria bacterium]MBI3338116.1 hypothetical protein [Candidatus Saccharibacteria bacterium]